VGEFRRISLSRRRDERLTINSGKVINDVVA
jgi:hypothetical protein